MRDRFLSLKPLHTLNISELEIGTMTLPDVSKHHEEASKCKPSPAALCRRMPRPWAFIAPTPRIGLNLREVGMWGYSTSPKVWQILWIYQPGKLHAGILKAILFEGWYHEVHFAAVLHIFGRFIFQPFSDISCNCIRITQPLSISFTICSCWIHVKVDWQFRFWWLFGISFPNCATCLGG